MGVAIHIDKILTNDLFLQHFQEFIVTATSSEMSDHNPIIIKVHTQETNKGNTI